MNLQTKKTSLIGGAPVTEILALGPDGWFELTSVWELDGVTYWEDPDAGTVQTGTVHEYTEWLITKTA